MKLAFGIFVFIWIFCGAMGSWWLGERDLKTFAKGPISLAKAYNENPPSYPGPN
jgi:hypothetical protein